MTSQKVFGNLIWRFLERCGAQGVTFIVSIILARLLDPSVYGIIALVTVFTSILQVFVDSGLGNALIQKKDADDLDFSTVFFANIFMCSLLYLIMFLSAPLIANFYNMPNLTSVVRVLSLTLVISGLKNVQQAYVSRTMQFKKFFFSTLGGTIGAGIIGIIIALKGGGVWAVVLQNIFNLTVDTFILWLTVKWRPKFIFSFERLKVLFAYGWKLLIASLMDNIYNNLRQLIIGKMYTSDALAYYNRGKQFPYLIATNINTSIDNVLFSAMSSAQENVNEVKGMTRRSIRMSCYIMAPLMIGLTVTAEPIVSLMLTDKWLPCVPFLRIFCIAYVFEPINTSNLNAIKALGRSDLFLKLNIIKRTIGLILLLISMKFGVMAIAYSMLIGTFFSQIVNTWPNAKMLEYNYIEQLRDVLPGIILAFVMGGCVYPISKLELNNIIILFIQVSVGAVIYILGSKLMKLDSLDYLLKMIKSMLKKNSNKENVSDA